MSSESYIIKKERNLTIARPVIDTSLPSFQDMDSATVFDKVSDVLSEGGKIFVKNAEYVINSEVNFRQSNIIISSDFATIKPGREGITVCFQIGRRRSATKINENIIVENLIFDGNYSNVPDGTGLYVAASDNVNIRNCVFKNTGQRDTIRTSIWDELEYRKNGINIEKCNFVNASISLGGIDSGSLRDCVFQGGPFEEYSTVDISFGEHNNSLVRNFNICGNKFIGINAGNRVISGLQRTEDIWINDNLFRDCTVPAIQSTTTVLGDTVLYRKRLHINNNKFVNCQRAIEMHADDTEIIGNVAENLTDTFIIVRGEDCTIANNKAKNVNRFGIIVYVPGAKITGNYLKDVSLAESRQYYRLETKNCDIIGNTAKCTGPAMAGAFLEAGNADYNFFSSNRIEGNFVYKYKLIGPNSIGISTFGYTPQKVEKITIGISPFIYINNDKYAEEIQIVGGNVSNISLIRGGIDTSLEIIGGTILLEPKDSIKVTWSVLPTIRKVPH